MKQTFTDVKGVLFDLDGVMLVGETAIAGAAQTLRHLDSKGIPYRFLTNTTTHSRESLFNKLNRMRLPITQEEILTSHRVAAHYLQQLGRPSCYLIVDDIALGAYKGIPLSETAPDYIVIGDIGDRWSYTLMNEIFSLAMDGAELIALHRGRYWQTDSGLRLDIGAFITGLEYATGKEAMLVGKPSAMFFKMALDDLGLRNDEVIMVGDDIESDVGGAQKAGVRGVLVKTGKYREGDLERSTVKPDAVIESVAELQRFL
jgi:HAD superfamily hydrolase (TIGR01458 family)